MPVSVTIEPFAPNVDMYDDPDTASAYSLSGHVVVALTPSLSLLGLSQPAPQNLLLTELELTFEGKSELVLNEIGYSPCRIVSQTKQLVAPAHPVHIAADDDRAEWRIVFDIAVPGWLPASAVFGDDDQRSAGVSYALYARARFLTADDAPPSMWNNLCAAVRLAPNRPRAVHAEPVPILLTRYVTPPVDDDADDTDDANPEFPLVAYAIQAVPDAPTATTTIPAALLRTLQLHALVPSRTPLAAPSAPLILRARAPPASGLRILAFDAAIVQLATHTAVPAPAYAAHFPLPPPAQQPPRTPLRTPHPVGALFDLGLVGPPPADARATREHALGAPRLFRVRGPDARAHGVPLEDAWLRMAANVPLDPAARPEPAGASPLRTVRHELRVRLAVGHDGGAGEGGRETSDELAFGVPLELVHLAPSQATAQSQSTASLVSGSSTRASTPAPVPALPAYSQLFYENGDRKEAGVALPLYREKEQPPPPPPSPSSSASPSPSPSPRTPLTPLTPPGLRRKFGESFLPFDDDDDTESDTEPEDVQYGVAL